MKQHNRKAEKCTSPRMMTKRESVDDVARIEPFHLGEGKAVCVTNNLLLVSSHFVPRCVWQDGNFAERNVKFAVDFMRIHCANKAAAGDPITHDGLKGDVVFDLQLKLAGDVHDVESEVCCIKSSNREKKSPSKRTNDENLQPCPSAVDEKERQGWE